MKLYNKNNTKKNWNLLIIIHSLYGGGAELVVENLCKLINKNIFNINVCYLKERGERGEELLRLGYNVFGLSMPGIKKVDYLQFLKLRKVIKKNRIDIVHSHSTDSLIDSSLCKLSLAGIKLVHTFHFGNYPNYIKKYLFAEKLFCRVPDKLVAVGNEQRKAILKTFSLSDRKIATIWNGVEEKKATIDLNIQKQFTNLNKVIIGTISTLIEQKGLTYLLDVADSLKRENIRCIFLIIGSGPLTNELKAKCHNLGLNNIVFFLGWIKDAVSRVLPILDILVLPSLWEAMSMVLLEGMMAGKAIIATDVGEAKHIIDNGISGYLVEPRDINNMAKALKRLIADYELRRRFGIEAKKKVKKCFTVEMMAKNYEKIYLDLVSK